MRPLQCIYNKAIVRSYSTVPSWITTIGLELHVQLKSSAKLFSPATPNTNVSYFDAALPGSLPVLSPEPVKQAIQVAHALHCTVHPVSKFDRKHYYYHDLPSGYQITQKYLPLATQGHVNLPTVGHPRIGIQQLQLEQDTAKTTEDAESGETLIDLNRAGAPLIEIISDPDLGSTQEAAAYVMCIRAILRALGASDANMEKGSLRIDINVSVRRSPHDPLGNRCEIKNLNSIRYMMQAIDAESHRQIALLEQGKSVEQQTRAYDPLTRQTSLLRSKENAPDYKYMPDPDLLPLVLPQEYINHVKHCLPELPQTTETRLKGSYGLQQGVVDRLFSIAESDADSADVFAPAISYFEQVVKLVGTEQAQVAGNWVVHELIGALAAANTSFLDNPITPKDLACLLTVLKSRTINNTEAKSLLKQALDDTTNTTLTRLVEQRTKASAASDTINLEALVASLIANNPDEVKKIRNGQEKVIMRLVGLAMKATSGKADARALQTMLRDQLLPK